VSLEASARIPVLSRTELGWLGREERLEEAIRLIEMSSFERREACRKCGGALAGNGMIRCLAPRRPSARTCDCLNLVW
jgi:hypothetical protein